MTNQLSSRAMPQINRSIAPERVVRTMFLPVKTSVAAAIALIVNSVREFEQNLILQIETMEEVRNLVIFCVWTAVV